MAEDFPAGCLDFGSNSDVKQQGWRVAFGGAAALVRVYNSSISIRSLSRTFESILPCTR